MKQSLGTVLIGGGSGFIGSAINSVLRSRGYNVLTVSRTPGLSRLTWTDLRKGLPKCVAVINVAGENLLNPRRKWTSEFRNEIWESRVETTKNLANLIIDSDPANRPKVFATISGVGYYKPSETTEYTEDSRGGDFDFLSRLAKNWEEAAEVPIDLNVRRVTVRSGVVLGREGGMINQLIWPFFFGLGGPIGSGKQFMPWIHVHDLARLFEHAIRKDQIRGVLNGVAPQVITNAQFSRCFGRHLWRPAVIPLPKFAVELMFGKERAKVMIEGQKVIPKRTLESGFEYVYPDIDSACKECARLIYADDIMHELRP